MVQVVHNDIKSKNILLTKDAAVAKIADVGTSRILESTACTLSVPMLYTWPYAAPEQISGNRHACSIKVSFSPRRGGGPQGGMRPQRRGWGFCELDICKSVFGKEGRGSRGGRGGFKEQGPRGRQAQNTESIIEA